MKELTQPVGGEAVESDGRVRYAANPFWGEIAMETKRKRTTLKGEDGPKALVSLATGQREGVVEVTKVYEVDAERFVKYLPGMSESTMSRRSFSSAIPR